MMFSIKIKSKLRLHKNELYHIIFKLKTWYFSTNQDFLNRLVLIIRVLLLTLKFLLSN